MHLKKYIIIMHDYENILLHIYIFCFKKVPVASTY